MGEFFDEVRKGKLTGPRKRDFTLEGWKEAYEKFLPHDDHDKLLYLSGQRIHKKLEAIRKATKQSSLSRRSTETRIKSLVSAANHQFEAIELQMINFAKKYSDDGERREINVRDLATRKLKLQDGNNYNVDSVLGSLLDSVAIPLKVAQTGQRRIANDTFDDVDWDDVILEINLGALYDQAENLWEDCVWNTYAVINKEDCIFALPLVASAKRGAHAAHARRVSLGIESTFYAIDAFKKFKKIGAASRIKEVQAVKIDGNHQSIQLGTKDLDPHRQSILFALRTMACPAYYDLLIGEPQKLLAGGTLSQLFDGWMVVSQAAKCLWDATQIRRQPESASRDELSDMSEYVPFFSRDALLQAVHEATGIPVPQTHAIIDFLTFNGTGKQQLWTQPLVSTGDNSRLYPVVGAIAIAPNLRFVLEHWMVQLGVKLDERGDAFEEHLRKELVSAVKTSPTLSQAAKAIPNDYTFKCKDKSFGQIDALFCIGEQVFVVEAKCILEPTESTSIGTHRVAIERAVDQLMARIELIELHREEFIADMKKFGWTLKLDFRVIPLVLVSTVAHVGVPCRGISVIDELILKKFFSGGYEEVALNTGSLSVEKSIFHSFYADAAEAEIYAESYFESPPQLEKYRNSLRLQKVPMYAVSEEDWGGLMVDFEQG